MAIEKTLIPSLNEFFNDIIFRYTQNLTKEQLNDMDDIIEQYVEAVLKQRKELAKILYTTDKTEDIDLTISEHLKQLYSVREAQNELIKSENNLGQHLSITYQRGSRIGVSGASAWKLRKAAQQKNLEKSLNEYYQKTKEYRNARSRIQERLKTSGLLAKLYHQTNLLRETILQIPELKYKIGVYDAQGQLYVVESTFERLKEEGIITISGDGKKMFFGSRQLSEKQKEKYSNNQNGIFLEKIDHFMQDTSILIKANQDLIKINNKKTTEKDKKEALKRIDEIANSIKDLKNAAQYPLIRQFDYLFSYINTERKKRSLTVGHMIEAFYHYRSIQSTTNGLSHGEILIKSVIAIVNNNDWLSGGDVTINGQEYQVKVHGGNPVKLKTALSFAEEILIITQPFEQYKKGTLPEEFAKGLDGVQKVLTQALQSKTKAAIEEQVNQFIEIMKI